MKFLRQIRLVACALLVPAFAFAAFAQGAQAPSTFEPKVGQDGKDVPWVPSPQVLADKMLDMAEVTPQDFLIDLGSGNGITVITAAKHGLRAHGIEYNPDLVALTRRNAAAEGVSESATFALADLFESDFSKAQVITMFLLPELNMRLRPTILDMAPGTRIVSNTFPMGDWRPDQAETAPGCRAWCTAFLWIVPAKVEGAWQLTQGALILTQQFQMVSGTLGSTPLRAGRLRGEEITFTAGDVVYTGRVQGNTISGTVTGGGMFTATKQ
jgi:hypothetical protein